MATTLHFWFRRKYGLAPTDERYLEATTEQIETDYWAHFYVDNPAKEESEDDDFDLDAELRDAANLAAAAEANDFETI